MNLDLENAAADKNCLHKYLLVNVRIDWRNEILNQNV